jgi:hypothetical protein
VQRCYFLELQDPPAPSAPPSTPEAVHQAAQFLYRDLVTPLGKSLDRLREMLPAPTNGGPLLETFGLHRLSWPRRELQQRLAERFCARLVDRWKTKDASALAEGIGTWVVQQWDRLEMRPENLIGRHQEQIEKALRLSPEKQFQEALKPMTQSSPAKGDAGTVPVGPAIAAMDRLDQLLGIPELARDAMHRNAEPATLERTLQEVSSAIADQCDARLAELVVNLIEAPQYRLAGAEEAIRALGRLAEQALKMQEALGKELSERAATLYCRIHEIFHRCEKNTEKSSAGSSASLWFGRKSTGSAVTSGADLLELLRVYAKAQYQALLLACINRLYISVRGHLSDQLREVGFCRQRLDELAGLLREKKTASRRGEFERYLLPPGHTRLEEIISALEEALTDDDVICFDEHIQGHIRKQYKALLNVCLGSSSTVRALAPAMVQEAEAYLDQRFPPPSIVDLLKAQEGDEGNLDDALRRLYDEASPELRRRGGDKEISAAALPGDTAGEPLRYAASALPAITVVPSSRSEEIFLVRERLLGALTDLEQMGPTGQEAYQQRLVEDPSSLHSREDIADWHPQPVACG